MARLLISLLMIGLALSACAKSEDVFSDIGNNIASPSSMIADTQSARLYLVNSNSKVLYDSTQGSFQVYDISNPLAPVLMNTVQTKSFSGKIYLDTAAKRAYVPNRYTASSQDTTALLYNFNIDESAADFLSVSETALDRDAFAVWCCYPAEPKRMWITTTMNELDYVNLTGDLTPATLPLATTLNNGGEITHAEVNFIAVIGAQAFLSREFGGLMVVNLDDAGREGAVPVDYFIEDIEVPRGLATDGTLIYVAGEGNINDTWTNYLLVLNPALIPPFSPEAENASTQVVDKDTSGMLVAAIEVGSKPQEVLVSTAYAFVTNQDSDSVSVIDRSSNTKVKDIEVGDEPVTLALYQNAEGIDQYVYVGNIADNTISIIEIGSLSVVATY